ncbi:MAG: LysR family transcriptional regulator [Devosia sp.]
MQKPTDALAWDNLEAILLVARARSMRQAAALCGLSHTTLARRIEAAESALGTIVFIKGTQGYALTEAGRAMLAHIERMAEEAEILRRSRGGDATPAGVVRIAIMPAVLNYCVAQGLPAFAAQHPLIDLYFDTRSGLADLDQHECDIAISYQEAPDDHLVGNCLGNLSEGAYASRAVAERFAAGEKPPLVIWSRTDSALRRIKQLGLDDHRVAFVCADVSSQIAMAEQALGIVVIPNIFGGGSDKLQRLNDLTTAGGRSVWVLTHPDLHRSIRIKAVTAFLTSQLRAVLAERN